MSRRFDVGDEKWDLTDERDFLAVLRTRGDDTDLAVVRRGGKVFVTRPDGRPLSVTERAHLAATCEVFRVPPGKVSW